MLPKTTPGASSGFASYVKRRAFVEGHPVNKNLGMPDEMVIDGKGTLRASYLSQSDCRIWNIMLHCSWILLINPFAPEPPVTARADPRPFYPL